ncbi:MAG: hypothetical protein K9N51_08905 [Candidatus Pacebacteria bacterium]|nr:hypothetical protein [Candidatus Paceibacterota bacterium]
MMRTLLSAILVICAITTGCQHEHPAITHVKVLDPEFKTICVITNSSILKELNQVWFERSTVEPSSAYKFTHKVDVSTEETGTRWLYDPSGYATVLSKARKPIYKFTNPDKLKGILIPQQAESTVPVTRDVVQEKMKR